MQAAENSKDMKSVVSPGDPNFLRRLGSVVQEFGRKSSNRFKRTPRNRLAGCFPCATALGTRGQGRKSSRVLRHLLTSLSAVGLPIQNPGLAPMEIACKLQVFNEFKASARPGFAVICADIGYDSIKSGNINKLNSCLVRICFSYGQQLKNYHSQQMDQLAC